MRTYAWVIDTDHLADQEGDEAGITGPSQAPPALLDKLKDGCGVKFRLRDGDNQLYYSGRIVVVDKDGAEYQAADSEIFFAPLDDFGLGNAGCTTIEYAAGHSWVAL